MKFRMKRYYELKKVVSNAVQHRDKDTHRCDIQKPWAPINKRTNEEHLCKH